MAVKVLQYSDDAQLRQFEKEITLLKSLSFDRNIVQFYGACLQNQDTMLLLEYMAVRAHPVPGACFEGVLYFCALMYAGV